MKETSLFFGKIWSWWKTRRLRVKIAIIAVVAIVLFILFGKGGDSSLVVEEVKRQDLERTVSASGTVVSRTDLALSFQETNLVKRISVTVGQKVRKGQILATLENASEVAEISSAKGNLLAAEARERKASLGSGGDEIKAAEVAVENTRRTLYSSDLLAEDEEGSTTNAPVITGSYNGSNPGVYEIEFDRSNYEIVFSGLERGRTTIGTSAKPLGGRGLLISFPDNVPRSIGNSWTIDIPNKNGSSYTANLNAYNDALANLSLKKSVAPSDVEAFSAEVISARGNLASAYAAFEKTVIRAPDNGTVSKIDVNIGELAKMFEPVITLQDIDQLYVESDVNESGVANLSIGQSVSVTYDALGKDRVYSASVTAIDLAPTVIDGIVNYKIKVQIPEDSSVKPGMTANLVISTARSENVLVIPERTITEKNGVKTVEVLVDMRRKKTETRNITTGLVGDGGLVEVKSGLSEGESILFKQK